MYRSAAVEADFLVKGSRYQSAGLIARHDVTSYGLGRLVVECEGKYPDLDLWMRMLAQNGKVAILHRYSERVGRGFSGYLWLFYKDEK